MRYVCLGALGAALCALPAQAGPRVLGKMMPKEVVCPAADTSKCVQSTGNTTPIWINTPQRFLPLDDEGRPLFWRYLGRELTSDASQTVNFCGNVFGTNPLEEYATRSGEKVVDDPYVGSAFTFNRKAKTVMSAGFNLDVDNALNAAGIPTGAGRAKAEAALQAATSKVRNTHVSMRGQYYFVSVNPSVVASLRATNTPAELQNCANYLAENRTSIVTALTGVKIETLSSADSVAAESTAGFDATLKDALTPGQIASLKAEFSKKVEQSWTVEFRPTFQVLSISGYRRAPT